MGFGFTNLYHSQGAHVQEKNGSSGNVENDNTATNKGRKRPNRQMLSSKEESTCSQCNYTFANKRELILHSEKAGCKSVLCDNCGKRFATSSTLRAHFCLSKRETIDADFEGIIEVQINTDTLFLLHH